MLPGSPKLGDVVFSLCIEKLNAELGDEMIQLRFASGFRLAYHVYSQLVRDLEKSVTCCLELLL